MVKLEDYTVKELKAIISKWNKKVKFSPYSADKKAVLINKLRKHKELDITESEDKNEGIVIKLKENTLKADTPKLKVSKKKLVQEINKKVNVKATPDKKGFEVTKKDGEKHTKEEVEVLKKSMPNSEVKVEGKKLVVKNKKSFKFKRKPKKEGTHKMPDGTVMSGKVHSKDSKPVKSQAKKKERSEKQKANDKKLGEMASKK